MQQGQGRKVAKIAGCSGCGCGVGLLVFIGTILYLTIFSNFCARLMGEETYPISGNPSQFDPIAAIPEIRAKVSPGAVLISFNATSVRADGTIDLMATYKPAPYADYTFNVPLDKAPDGQTAPPIGAGRGPDDVWIQQVTVRVYEPGQRRHVNRISGASRSSYSYTNEGMDIDRQTPRMQKLEKGIDSPKVTTKQMWAIAEKLGANKEAVATIRFSGDTYEFRIMGTDIDLRWDENGKLGVFWLKDDQKKKLGLKEE